MDFVTQKSNVQLIKQIRLRPCLYNKNLPSYNNKYVQDKAWEEVAKRMGWQASQCKERWRNLRCVYTRHVKGMSQGVHIRPYYLMKVMSFALPFVKPANCKPLPKEIIESLQEGGDKEAVVFDDEEEQEQSTRNSFESPHKRHMGSESPEPSPSALKEFVPSTSVEIKREDDPLSDFNLGPTRNDQRSRGKDDWSKRSRVVSNGFEVEMSDLSTNIDLKTDARKMFLYSLLPDVYAMTDAQMRQFKMKVLNAIGDIFDSNN